MPRSATRSFSGTDATASDDVELINLGPDVCRQYNEYTVHPIAGTVDVEVAVLDGDTPTVQPLRDTSGAVIASQQVGPGEIGIIEGHFDRLIVRKKGITNPTTVRLQCGNG